MNKDIENKKQKDKETTELKQKEDQTKPSQDLKPSSPQEEAAAPIALEKKDVSKTPLYSLRVNGGLLKTSIDFPFLKQEHPEFSVGDTIRIHFRIREGNKERIQVYEGAVIAFRGEGTGRSFIVRRVTYEVGVERIFPYYSPMIKKIEVIRRGRVRRARLYYLRGKSGKEGRIKEAFANFTRKEKDVSEDPASNLSPSKTSPKPAKKVFKKTTKKVPKKKVLVSKKKSKKSSKKTSKAGKTSKASKKTSKKSSKGKKQK